MTVFAWICAWGGTQLLSGLSRRVDAEVPRLAATAGSSLLRAKGTNVAVRRPWGHGHRASTGLWVPWPVVMCPQGP